jgi:DNA-directed RNA polymerase specialized sigma24 family protein
MQGTPNHPRGLTKLALAMTPELRRILRAYTQNWADTYDLLQDLLLQILGRNVHDLAAARARLCQLAHRIGAKWHSATRISLATQVSLTGLQGYVGYTHATPESVLDDERRQGLLRQAIADFPPRQKEAWQLVKFEGRSCKEAARTMDVSLLTIQTYMRDGMIDCRRRLQAREGLV